MASYPSHLTSGEQTHREVVQYTVTSVLLALSIFSFALRFTSKRLSKLGIKAEDKVALAGGLFCAAFSVLTLLGSSLTPNIDSADLKGARYTTVSSPDSFRYYRIILYTEYLLWPPSTLLLKLSLLLFYARVFFYSASLHRHAFLLAIIASVCALAFEIAFSGSCTPVSAFWTLGQGSCVREDIIPLVCGSVNIFLDGLVLLTPLGPLLKLRVSRAKKIKLTVVFMIGGAAVGIGIAGLIIGWKVDRRQQLVLGLDMWPNIHLQTSYILSNTPHFGPLYHHFRSHPSNPPLLSLPSLPRPASTSSLTDRRPSLPTSPSFRARVRRLSVPAFHLFPVGNKPFRSGTISPPAIGSTTWIEAGGKDYGWTQPEGVVWVHESVTVMMETVDKDALEVEKDKAQREESWRIGSVASVGDGRGSVG